MEQFELNRTKDKSKIDAKPIKDGSAYLAVDEQSQSGDLYIDYGEKRYNVSGNVGYKKITTKGFEIISFEEINNDTNKSKGYYVLNVTDLSQDIKDKLVGKTITLMNVENVDSYSTIIKVTSKLLKLDDTTFDFNNYIHLYVDKIYTNSVHKFYKQSNYIKNGKIDFDKRNGTDKIYPDLGWTIAARTLGEINYSQQACLFINDYPELGTFDWFQDSYALSAENGNLAQGKGSFAQGQDNKAYGKYSFASGKQNKVGYADTAFGRENDLSQGQNIFAAGFGNKAENLDAAAYSTMLGSYNISGKTRNKLIAGSYNNDKATNVFEIGNGGDGKRHNLFEVDKQGRIASNEKYLEGYEIYSGTFNFSNDELKNYLSPSDLTFSFRQIDQTHGYGPYFLLGNIINLQEEGWYIIQVKLTNNDSAQTLTLPLFRALERYENDTDDKPGDYSFKPLSCKIRPNESIILELPINIIKEKNGSPAVTLGFYGDEPNTIARVALTIEPLAIYKAKEITMEKMNKDYNCDIASEKGTFCLNGLSKSCKIVTDKIYNKVDRSTLILAVDQDNSNKLLVFPYKSLTEDISFSENIYTSNIIMDKLYTLIEQQRLDIKYLKEDISDLYTWYSTLPNYYHLEIELLQPTSNNQSLWKKVDNQNYYSYTINLAAHYSNINTIAIIGYNVNDSDSIDKLALSKIVVGNNGQIQNNSFTLFSYGELPINSVIVNFIFIIMPNCPALEVE